MGLLLDGALTSLVPLPGRRIECAEDGFPERPSHRQEGAHPAARV